MLLIPVGSAGDVHPFLGLGLGLRARGHDVKILTNPHFQPLCERLGFHFLPFGTVEDFNRSIADPDLWHHRKAFKYVVEIGILPYVEPLYRLLADQFSDGETVIVAASIALGARIAQDKLGIPLATVQLQPGVFKSIHEPGVYPAAPVSRRTPKWFNTLFFKLVEDFVLAGLLDKPINALRERLNLPPIRRVMFEWWNSPQAVIALFPDWYGVPQPDWPKQVRTVGFPLFDASVGAEVPEGLEDFLAAGDPPIVFTPGSAMRHANSFFEESLDVCQLLKARGLFLTSYPEQLPTSLPSTIQHFSYIPFSKVFPRSAAIVHHGGIGTSAQGLAAGVPQLIMPFAHDQPDNADRLRRLGVGSSIKPRRYKAKTVARELGGARLGPSRLPSAVGTGSRKSIRRPRSRRLARWLRRWAKEGFRIRCRGNALSSPSGSAGQSMEGKGVSGTRPTGLFGVGADPTIRPLGSAANRMKSTRATTGHRPYKDRHRQSHHIPGVIVTFRNSTGP